MTFSHASGDAAINVQEFTISKLKKIDLKTADAAAAVALQRAWRQRMVYVSYKKLKQEKLCSRMREEMRAGLQVDCDACASAGKLSTDIKSRNLKKAWKHADELLFKGIGRLQISDRGDNWNERWQEALSLPNNTPMTKGYRRSSLDAVYSDFVHTAVTYGRTIISEYFLHEYMKSVKPKQLGGVAGGKKYLWRGILFKLVDGSQGPYGGSDEAAAKAAGHELRAASEYLKTRVGLCVPPMCLLDYKGFRMLAQALLPLGDSSMKMGTNDGGRTVHNECRILDYYTSKAARKLGLRAHTVGGKLAWDRRKDPRTGERKKRKINVGGQMLHAAADVEGHEGADSRMYLLDLARAFPPEDPNATLHLSGMLSVNAKVMVQKDGQKAAAATVTRAHTTLVDYDILYPDGTVVEGMAAHMLRDLRLFIFYRLMRPEFVRDRGRKVLSKVKLPPKYEFPRVMVTNPMMFAIQYARSSVKPPVAPSSNATVKERYTTGDEDSIPSFSRGTPSLTPPATAPQKAPNGVYETFVDPGRLAGRGSDRQIALTGGYASGLGLEGDGPDAAEGDVVAGSDMTAHDAWKREAMECGIEFVVSGDKYYEGFKRADVEEDEEEMKLRGGMGYRPFGDAENELLLARADGYTGMAGDLSNSATGLRDGALEPLPPTSRRRVFAASNGGRGHGPCAENGVPERRGKLAPTDALIQTGASPRFSESFTRRGEAVVRQSDAVAETKRAWDARVDDISDINTGSDGSEEGGGGDGNYVGFDTESASSSIFSTVTGDILKRMGSEVFGHGNQSANGGLWTSSSPVGNVGYAHPRRLPPPSATVARRSECHPTDPSPVDPSGYDKFSARSLVSQQSSQNPLSPMRGRHAPTNGDVSRVSSGGTGDNELTGNCSSAVLSSASLRGDYDKFSLKSLPSERSTGSLGSVSDLSIPPPSAGRNGVFGSPSSDKHGDLGDGGSSGVKAGGGDVGEGYTNFLPSPQNVPPMFVHGTTPRGRRHGQTNSVSSSTGAIAGDYPEERFGGEGGASTRHRWRGVEPSEPQVVSDAGSGGGAGVGRASGYAGFVPQTPGDSDFIEDVAESLPPPRELSATYNPSQAGQNRPRGTTRSRRRKPHGSGRRQPPRSPAVEQAPFEPQHDTNNITSGETMNKARPRQGDPPPYQTRSETTGQRKGNGNPPKNRPVPLSPDALTAFSNADPDAKERNREVSEATQFLLTVLVPATARLLCAMPPAALARVNLATELHRYGVNVRHIGLLRAHVIQQNVSSQTSDMADVGPSVLGTPAHGRPASSGSGGTPRRGGSNGAFNADGFSNASPRVEVSSGERRRSGRRGSAGGETAGEWFVGKPSTAILRDRALVEVVVRTLKLVLRSFQRRWMKSEQSASEQGMHLLIAQFLNLVTGKHERSELFWREHVTTGVCQRFGTVALTNPERAGLWAACSERPYLLRMIVKELVRVTGVRFKESVNQKLRGKRAVVVNVEFSLTDIRDIEAVVTPMTIYPEL